MAGSILCFGEVLMRLSAPGHEVLLPVSYTHLDVYKRQGLQSSRVVDPTLDCPPTPCVQNR